MLSLTTFTWTKNKKIHFTGCCENTAMAAGVNSPAAMIGQSDFDLIWRDRALNYLPGDESALKGDTHRQLEQIKTTTGIIQIFTVKSPLFNQHQKIIGIVGCSIDITEKSIIKRYGTFDKKGNLLLGEYFGNEYLTCREAAILKWLLRGYPSKKIGVTLNISSRTVEAYIENIKAKLQCRTKGDIFWVTVQSGLFYLLIGPDAP